MSHLLYATWRRVGIVWRCLSGDCPSLHVAADKTEGTQTHSFPCAGVRRRRTSSSFLSFLRPHSSKMAYYSNNRSPPPLQHPVPTHPAYIPEPPATPASPQGYERYTSSPPQPPTYQQHPHQSPPLHNVGYGQQYTPVNSPPRQPPIHGQIPPHLGGPAVAPVDLSAWGLNDATAQFGMQLGQNAVAAGQDYVTKNVRAVYFIYFCALLKSTLARRPRPHYSC